MTFRQRDILRWAIGIPLTLISIALLILGMLGYLNATLFAEKEYREDLGAIDKYNDPEQKDIRATFIWMLSIAFVVGMLVRSFLLESIDAKLGKMGSLELGLAIERGGEALELIKENEKLDRENIFERMDLRRQKRRLKLEKKFKRMGLELETTGDKDDVSSKKEKTTEDKKI